MRHPANIARHEQRTLGQKAADAVAAALGSWRFLICQSLMIGVWMALNTTGVVSRWDPYPFILLNLMLSLQAAYAAPVLQLSGNRQVEHDRRRAEVDYAVNTETLDLVRQIAAQVKGDQNAHVD